MNFSADKRSIAGRRLTIMRLNTGQKIAFFAVSMAFYLFIFCADTLLLPAEIQLIVPYAIVACAATLFIGDRAGLFFSVLTVLFWFSSKTKGFSHFTPAAYINLTIKTFFTFGLFMLMRFTRGIFRENEELALVDDLTGMYNRRGFLHLARFEIRKRKTNIRFFSVLFIDIDNFKYVNDAFGHEVGDTVLKEFKFIVLKNTQRSDISARIGGDEFCLLLPTTQPADIPLVAHRIIHDFNALSAKNNWCTTLSVGGYSTKNRSSLEELMSVADNLMYEAKQNGGNQLKHKIDF